MAKENKKTHKVLTEEDMKIIQSDPNGLADYIIYTKIKDAKKTALIFTIIFVVLSFGAGVFAGMNITKNSIPNNVVQVQVGGSQDATVDTTEAKVETEEGK